MDAQHQLIATAAQEVEEPKEQVFPRRQQVNGLDMLEWLCWILHDQAPARHHAGQTLSQPDRPPFLQGGSQPAMDPAGLLTVIIISKNISDQQDATDADD